MAAVKTVSLTKEYSNGEHYLRAVDDISFTVEENEFVAIREVQVAERPRCSIY